MLHQLQIKGETIRLDGFELRGVASYCITNGMEGPEFNVKLYIDDELDVQFCRDDTGDQKES